MKQYLGVIWSDDNEVKTFDTHEEAKDWVEGFIEHYRDSANGDGWPEFVQGWVAEIVAEVEQEDLGEPPEGSAFDYWCDYKVKPRPLEPALSLLSVARSDWPVGPWPVDMAVYLVHPEAAGTLRPVSNTPDSAGRWPDFAKEGWKLLALDIKGHATWAPWGAPPAKLATKDEVDMARRAFVRNLLQVNADMVEWERDLDQLTDTIVDGIFRIGGALVLGRSAENEGEGR